MAVKDTGQGRNRLPRLCLEEHRVRRGVTLEQIADSTKISRRFLSAIEAGDYAQLPGGVFTTSYIRQYAQATGYDALEILDHYAQSSAPASAPAAEEARGGEPQPGFQRFANRFFTIG